MAGEVLMRMQKRVGGELSEALSGDGLFVREGQKTAQTAGEYPTAQPNEWEDDRAVRGGGILYESGVGVCMPGVRRGGAGEVL